MKAASHLVPPPDLLSQVEGVETELRRARNVGLVGWAAFAVSAAQLVVVLLTSSFWRTAATVHRSQWPLVLAALVLGLSLLLINWTRVWLRVSREPFRFTYSVEDFQLVSGAGAEQRTEWIRESSGAVAPEAAPAEPPLAWLRHDLINTLSERVRRLDLLEEQYSGATKQPEAHIHIGGSYGIRQRPDEGWMIEVLPWIRLGPTGSSARLAHNVAFPLGSAPELGTAAYDKLRERVYFSIATELYREIRHDVQRKIDLLPKRYFRAAAYFHEAKDYARSNTLDAYEQAQDLYEEVLRLYDPLAWPSPGASDRWLFRRLAALRPDWSLAWRRRLARLWPRLGTVELMVARAELGYANVLLDRRQLAGMSGLRLNPIYEALPVAQRALQRLEAVPSDASGWLDVKFDAFVTLAATYCALGSSAYGRDYRTKAERLDPARAQQNSRFHYVTGQIEPRQDQSMQSLRRAVELAPGFEAAQFALATAAEMFWRTRPTLEENVAEIVAAEYERVLLLNPGNIAAWANLGYVHWLLDDQVRAEQSFLRGRDYKEIKHETFVAELDYGLGRIAAEQGDFNEAYKHYISAASVLFAPPAVFAASRYAVYHFQLIDRSIVTRFERYARTVRERWEDLRRSRDPGTPARIADSVYAFVLNDYGEACFNYFLRSYDERFLELAHDKLNEAVAVLKTRYPMVYLNFFRVLQWRGESSERIEAVGERMLDYAPFWPDGKLALAVWRADYARAETSRADRLEQEATELKAAALAKTEEARQKHLVVKNAPFASSEAGDPSGAPAADQPETPWSELLDRQPASWLDAAEALEVPLHEGYDAFRLRQSDLPLRALPAARVESGVRPLPQVDYESLQADAQRLAHEAEVFHQQAKETRGQALAARQRAKRLKNAALETPIDLLPHSWLWLERGRHREFDWSVFERADYQRERKLERELGDLHIRALFAWASHGMPKDDADQQRHLELLRQLLDRFLPDDFEVLTACRDFCGPEDDTPYERRLAALIDDWAAADPAWWALRFGVEPGRQLFSPADAVPLLRRAAESRGLPISLCIWIGDRLWELSKRVAPEAREVSSDAAVAALAAYERAGASEDPAVLFELGLTLRRHDLLQRSLEVLEESRMLAESRRGETDLPLPPSADTYRRTVATVLWKLGRTSEASAELARIDADELSPEIWRALLVREILDDGMIDSAEGYRPLKNWLGRVVTRAEATGNAAALRDAADALLELTLRRYQAVVRRPHDKAFADQAAEMTPIAAPLVLAADAALFPHGAETEEVTRLLDPHTGPLVAMKQRIKESSGVGVPGVTIRPVADAPAGRFSIRVNDTPVAVGTAGTEGAELWARYESMLAQLEAVLLRNLDAFLGVQNVVWLLAEWETKTAGDAEERRKLRIRALPDDEALGRLAAVLQALAAERVPVTNLTAILQALATAPAAVDALQLVELVRAGLTDLLPGADASRQLIRVPHKLESAVAGWTHHRRGKHFLALPGEAVEGVRAVLGRELDGLDGAACVVVSEPGLRPFVRKLLPPEHAGVSVVSLSELPDSVLSSTDWSPGL